jgi:hypothetical protein
MKRAMAALVMAPVTLVLLVAGGLVMGALLISARRRSRKLARALARSHPPIGKRTQ